MLSAKGIVAQINKGNVVIDPFVSDNLGPNSYDITLGEWVIRNKKVLPYKPVDLSDIESLERVFLPPTNHKKDGFIIWREGERLLAHTEEFIGTRHNYVPQLQTRSTLARWGVDICMSAGFGDVGYVNRWTLEISNMNDFAVSIPVGARIGQMFFDSLSYPASKIYTGQYNTNAEQTWKPSDMLPKAIAD